ncbi:MAG: zinc ribbon domain-containing protein [Clostridiales bacterium]|nr:zinc ribbon domain-containing protein [Clostridiales bacterium]
MFCRYCGKKIDENLRYCPFCGAEQASESVRTPDPFDTAENKPAPSKPEEGNTLAVAGFVLAFFVPIAGLICSWLGYKNSREKGLPYGGLAKAGFIVSIVYLAIYALSIIIGIVITVIALNSGPYDPYYTATVCNVLSAL